MSFGIWELGIIMVIVALLFGTKKLGSIGGDLGSGAIRLVRLGRVEGIFLLCKTQAPAAVSELQ